MRYLILLLIFLPFTLISQSKYHKIDSIKSQLVENSTDSIKVENYRNLAYAYRFINVDTSIHYCQLSYGLAGKNNWPKQEIQALLGLGFIELYRGNILDCDSYFSEALKIGQEIKDTFLMARVVNAIGTRNWNGGRNDQAIKNYQDAYDFSIVSKDEKTKFYALNNLGLISLENERFDQALAYFEKAQLLPHSKNETSDKVLIILNIGVTNMGQKKYELALSRFQEAKALAEPAKLYVNLSLIYMNIGEVKKIQKRYEEAINSLDKSISIARKNELKDLIIKGSLVKSKTLIEIGEYAEAINYLKEGLAISQEIGAEAEIPECYELLASAFEGKADYKNAMLWQKKYSILADSLYKLGREKDISQLEISFQTREKDMENSLLKKEKEQQESLVYQRTRIAIVTSIVLLLLIVVAYLLYQGRRKTHLMNKVLEEKVMERTEKLEGLNKQLVRSNEELKRFAFIASHDLKEPLRNVGGFLSLIRRKIKKQNDKDLNEYIEFVEQNNLQMVDLVDNILRFSKIDTLKKTRLEVVDLRKEAEVACILLSQIIKDNNAEITIKDLPNIYFNASVFKIIFKNLIENGIKYNKSKPVKVNIFSRKEGDRLLIYIKDNGIGIAPEYHEKVFEMFTRLHNRSAYKGSGMGLAFCKKLIDNNNGFIKIESKEMEGSTFIIDIPAKIVNSDKEMVLETKINVSV